MKHIDAAMRALRICCAALAIGLHAGGASAAFPDKPINLYVGFAAGGLPDVMARSLAEAAKPFLGQTMVVVNKPGATGSIAAATVASAAADGYTLGIIYAPTISVVPVLSEPSYKGPEDFKGVVNMVQAPMYLIVKGDAKWKSAAEFFADAKALPGRLRVGTSGAGSIGAIVLDQLRNSGMDIISVPFQGAAQGVTALLGGHIDGILANAGSVTSQLGAGTARLLAVFEPKRVTGFPGIPDVPTATELGYPVIARSSGYYVVAPKGTPDDVVAILADALTKAMASETFTKFAFGNGLIVEPAGPRQLQVKMVDDFNFMRSLLKPVAKASN